MVKLESKKSMITFVPECTCNKKNKNVVWKINRKESNLDEIMQIAHDHEELHKLSHDIINFISDTGKTMAEDILSHFAEYNEEQISIAANMCMNPIIFPKRRHVPYKEFIELRNKALILTNEYRRAKYADTHY